ncbi:hypothetical protein PVAND_015228 [Polypedilum vanderplanki]|uniref:Uncharacterized protein n=1 Tax=Polypedilum vanderplanki TaxID=319348 RepID=A0A9J6BCD8_POLVA|nr:hypothetical protein PVAND_015228 [Polypedilum vanderplanki]
MLVILTNGEESKEKDFFECVEYGLSAGYYAPGKKAYIGLGNWNDMLLNAGRIQLDPPGLLIPSAKNRGIFLNDSNKMWYLARRNHHRYNWIASENGKDVPFAIEYGVKTSGLKSYIGRIKKNQTVFLGIVVPGMNVMYFVDENGNSQTSNTYDVLTCKSYKNETAIPLPRITATSSLSSNVDSSTGCIHNWQPYNNDDAPAKNGISAGEHDCGNTAYVGYGNPANLIRPGRLQIIDKKGIYLLHKKTEVYLNDSSVYYLLNNHHYTYKWVTYDGNNKVLQNAVFTKNSNRSLKLPIARVKTNGHIHIGFFVSPIAYFPTNDGKDDEVHIDFEILVCDPWPKYKCTQQWKKLNANISVDGFSVDSTSFIGRGTRKCINGCDYGLGKIQSGSNGVNYLDDLSATAVFDNSSNVEYLVKNPSDTYKWQPSRNGVKVVNALELHKEGHRPFYIGMTRINDNVVVGKVRPGDGLFFIDPVTGKQQSTSSYEVLTCTSPDASNGEYEEESDADWFGSFGCPVRKEWSFIKWRCVCRDEFRDVFAFSGAKWNDETCSYV